MHSAKGFLDISDIPNGARPGSTCLDIDECLQKTADCDPDATTNQGVACINTVGSFACQCKDGFLPNDVKITDNDSSPESYCDDIPECEDNIDTCMKDAHEDLTSFPGTRDPLTRAGRSSDQENFEISGPRRTRTRYF